MQFLSIALLSRPKVVEICDELESFFYVIVYHAVRYLESNLREQALDYWIDTFFDMYSCTNDAHTWGEQKIAAIKRGALIISNDERLEFDSPMDELLTKLLTWLRGHNVVTSYTREQQRRQALQHTAAQALIPFVPLPPDPRRNYWYSNISCDEDDSDDDVSDPLKPTEKDNRYWKYIQTHNRIIRLLDVIVHDREWLSDDRRQVLVG